MKKILILLFLMVSINCFSQLPSNKYKKGTLHLTDGSELRGLIKISGNTVKLKKTKEDKKQLFNYRKVKRVKFLYEDEYLYKLLVKKKKSILIKREIKGKINLYSLIGQSPTMSMGSGFRSLTIGGGSYKVYYIGKENSDYIEKIPNTPKKKKFLKILSKYTSDCNEFINILKDKEILEYYFERDEEEEKKDQKSYSRGYFEINDSRMRRMINYYNSHCNKI